MTAELTFSELYWNASLLNFFFHSQAREEFEEVMKVVITGPDRVNMVGDFLESQFSTVDEMEAYFYEESAENILEEMRDFGIPIELNGDEEEEDEEEEGEEGE